MCDPDYTPGKVYYWVSGVVSFGFWAAIFMTYLFFWHSSWNETHPALFACFPIALVAKCLAWVLTRYDPLGRDSPLLLCALVFFHLVQILGVLPITFIDEDKTPDEWRWGAIGIAVIFSVADIVAALTLWIATKRFERDVTMAVMEKGGDNDCMIPKDI